MATDIPSVRDVAASALKSAPLVELSLDVLDRGREPPQQLEEESLSDGFARKGSLKKLHFTTRFPSRGLEHLAATLKRNPGLESLAVDFAGYDGRGEIENILASHLNPQIQSLEFGNVIESESLQRLLARFTQLEHLSVSAYLAGARGIATNLTLGVLPHLRSLEIKTLDWEINSSHILPLSLASAQLSVLAAEMASFPALQRLILHAVPSPGCISRLRAAFPAGCEVVMTETSVRYLVA